MSGQGTFGGVCVRLGAEAMGTRFELALHGGDAVRLRAAGEAALGLIGEWDRRCSWFSPASLLSHVNRCAPASPVAIDQEFFELLRLCRDVWVGSGGAFDITIAPLMAAWGFRGRAFGGPEAVAATRELVGTQHVLLTDRPPSVSYARPGVSMDLGSVAKGAALDAAAALLRDCGVQSALIHGGTSSVVAIGSPPGRESWAVAIETASAARPVFHLRDSALSVSAPRGRMAITPQGPVGHVLDPRTGAPVQRLGTACVVHQSAAFADAWSTALLVLGERPPTLPAEVVTLLHLAPVDPPLLAENAA